MRQRDERNLDASGVENLACMAHVEDWRAVKSPQVPMPATMVEMDLGMTRKTRNACHSLSFLVSEWDIDGRVYQYFVDLLPPL
jgi:hypothetical protein